MTKKLLVTGAKGLLGKQLKKHLDFIGIDIEEMDITSKDSIRAGMIKYDPDVVLHLAAFTDVASAEAMKKEVYRVNVWGTGELAKRSKRFIYMSTEYVFDGEKGNYHEGAVPNPVNFYSLTKLLGEHEAQRAGKCSIIRTLFKPNPYEHKVVPTDMWTSGDYVSVIAPMIALAVKNEASLPNIIHIGTGRKNLYDLARRTKKVIPVKRVSLPIKLPRDTSLDTTLWEMLNYDSRTKTDN